MVARISSVLPTFQIYAADVGLNLLTGVDNVTIRCTSPALTLLDSSYAVMSNGVASFSNVTLLAPSTGLFGLLCGVITNPSISATVALYIRSGPPDSIRFILPPPIVTSSTPLGTGPIAVIQDAVGNLANVTVQVSASIDPTPVSVVGTTTTSSSGTIEFPSLSFVGLHHTNYTITLSLSAPYYISQSFVTEFILICPDYQDAEVGASVCGCNYGLYLDSDTNDCVSCPVNTYKDSIGPQRCTACAANQVSPIGSTTAAACACRDGYYAANDTCEVCPEGALCTGGSSLTSLPGYWRAPNTTQLYACNEPSACLGYDQCAEGHIGPLCAICTQGYAVDLSGSCTVCRSSGVTWLLLAVTCGVITLLLLLLIRATLRKKSKREFRWVNFAQVRQATMQRCCFRRSSSTMCSCFRFAAISTSHGLRFGFFSLSLFSCVRIR